ncbi:MAG TPA: proline--tRNA ligase, partial [Candidatus Peregrinibacteria bacterium]|nr:proline--tRNA ligase [Candidatus Peregrinibacteria bacterium]
TRTIAALIEQNHDDKGIIWSKEVCPHQVHLVGLNLEDEKVKKAAEKLYEKLLKEDIDVLYDDRDSRPGEKFADADLIGIPIRLTISSRTLEKKAVEFKPRNKKDFEVLSETEVLKKIKNFYK